MNFFSFSYSYLTERGSDSYQSPNTNRMKRMIFILMAMLLVVSLRAQTDTNYWHYHELIYKAECALFDNNNNVEQGFQYYDQAFNNFEFNTWHWS